MRKIRRGSLILVILVALCTILSVMIPAMVPDGPMINPLTLEVVNMCGGDNKTRNVTVHNPYSTPIDCCIIPKILPDGKGLNVTFFISGTVFFSGDTFIVDAYQDLDVQVNVTADFALMVLPYILYLEFYSDSPSTGKPLSKPSTYNSRIKIGTPPGDSDDIPGGETKQDDETPVEPDEEVVVSGFTVKKDAIFDEILFLISIFAVVIISLLILLINKRKKKEGK